ncbi:hypothetical protein [Enhygromyxa salina]|nr:hypothetical protein [Enhygromyxa salina]
MPALSLTLLTLVLAPVEPPTPTAGPGRAIEIVVETKKRPDWLFPGLAHPRVQAYFRSGSSVGNSLFDEPQAQVRRPLVRAGAIKVRGAEGRAQRKAARRFARDLVADVRPALEACYADALERRPTDATRLTFHVALSGEDRGPVTVSAGVLGDVYGNACVHGVLEFADVVAPQLEAAVDIPVWFWLQSV